MQAAEQTAEAQAAAEEATGASAADTAAAAEALEQQTAGSGQPGDLQGNYDPDEFAANQAAYNTWREAAGFNDTAALRELYLNATLRGEMSTTLNGEPFTVTAPNGPEGLYQVVRGEFVDGYNQNNLDSAYDGLANQARQVRLASAPTITDEADVLNTIMQGGEERFINNGTNTVTVEGYPQGSTDLTPNHQSSIAFAAAQLAMLPDTEAIYINQSLSTIIPGPDFAPDIRPDIVRVTTDGAIEITEIQSNSQSFTYLRGLVNSAVQQIDAYSESTGEQIDILPPRVINADYTPQQLQAALAGGG